MSKTIQILKVVESKNVVSLAELSKTKQLLELFENSSSTTPQRRIIDSCALLVRQGFLTAGQLDNEKILKITIKGRLRLSRSLLLDNTINTTRWDGRWYLITFDLPEARKSVRNQIILTLKRNGCINYTKGIWILPYNPAKLVDGLRVQFNLKAEIRLIVASHIDQEKTLLKHFKLSR